jgi:hypothetical protein
MIKEKLKTNTTETVATWVVQDKITAFGWAVLQIGTYLLSYPLLHSTISSRPLIQLTQSRRAVLEININSNISGAMWQAQKALDQWRVVLNDQWNTHGILGGIGYGVDGQPLCTRYCWGTHGEKYARLISTNFLLFIIVFINSHYGFHMVEVSTRILFFCFFVFCFSFYPSLLILYIHTYFPY